MTIGPTGRRLIDALNRAAHTAAGAHRTEPPVTEPTSAVLAEVAAERRRQDDRWGEQNHPDGTGLPIYWHSARRHRHSAERRLAAARASEASIHRLPLIQARRTGRPPWRARKAISRWAIGATSTRVSPW